MKNYTYRSVWHDGGCIIFRSDGKRCPIVGKRLTTEEVNRMGNAVAKLSPWKRFEA